MSVCSSSLAGGGVRGNEKGSGVIIARGGSTLVNTARPHDDEGVISTLGVTSA